MTETVDNPAADGDATKGTILAERWTPLPLGLLADRDVPPLAKLAWAALADHLRGDGRTCRPSLSRLAEMTGSSPRGVQQAVDRLVAAGWIEADVRSGRATIYRLHLTATRAQSAPVDRPTPAQSAPVDPRTKCAGPDADPRTKCRTPAHKVPGTRAQSAPEQCLVSEGLSEKEKTKNPPTPRGGEGCGASLPDGHGDDDGQGRARRGDRPDADACRADADAEVRPASTEAEALAAIRGAYVAAVDRRAVKLPWAWRRRASAEWRRGDRELLAAATAGAIAEAFAARPRLSRSLGTVLHHLSERRAAEARRAAAAAAAAERHRAAEARRQSDRQAQSDRAEAERADLDAFREAADEVRTRYIAAISGMRFAPRRADLVERLAAMVYGRHVAAGRADADAETIARTFAAAGHAGPR